MSIGKPKNDPIDLNGLMNEIENDHRITVESDAIDKHIEELRAAQKTYGKRPRHWKRLQ